MNDNYTFFETIHAIDCWPKLINMAIQTTSDPNYQFRGQDRQDEKYSTFQFTLKGQGEYHYRGKSYQLKPGSGFLCRVYDKEMSYNFPKTSSEAWQFIYINFSHADEELQALIDRHGPHFTLNDKSPSINRLKKYALHQELTLVQEQFEASRFVWDLLQELIRSTRHKEQPRKLILRQALSIVQEKACDGLKVQDLAAELQISREHLTRIFTKEFKKSPHRYITERRMLQACQLLKNTNSSCKEIAYAIGDPSVTHFSAQFKTTLKVTPLEYREFGTLPLFD